MHDYGRFVLCTSVVVLATSLMEARAHDFLGDGRDMFAEIAGPSVPSEGAASDPALIVARSVVDLFKLWDAGDTLTACFMGGSPDLRAFFVEVGKTWDDAISVNFDYGDPPGYRDCANSNASRIRISFEQDGSWSYVGTDALSIPSNEATLNIAAPANLASANRRKLGGTILHELGHALALKHEHQSPESDCETELNWPLVYAALSANGWDQNTIDRNMRQFVSSPRLRVSEYDRESIMHYSLPVQWFIKGPDSSCWVARNDDVSAQDLAAAAEAYPQSPQRQNTYIRDLSVIGAAAVADLGLSEEQVKLVEDQIDEMLARVPEREVQSNLGTNVERIITFGDCSPVVTSSGDVKLECRFGD